MKKKKTRGLVPVGTQGIFPAEEMLKVEKGTFWSKATKATKENIRKEKTFTKVDEYKVKDNHGHNVTFGTYVPNLF